MADKSFEELVKNELVKPEKEIVGSKRTEKKKKAGQRWRKRKKKDKNFNLFDGHNSFFYIALDVYPFERIKQDGDEIKRAI